jgi:hypothetical protein
MRQIPHFPAFLTALCVALLIDSACGPRPQPVPPITGGATSTGGTGVGGWLPASGASGGTTGTGGATVAVAFPRCDRSVKAPLRVRPPMSGWRRDESRAKSRRFRPSYQVIPGTVSVFWPPNVTAALDQGSLGSCTGNAVAQCLSTRPFSAALTEADAVAIYSRATRIDPFAGVYPPTDTGSNGASAWKAALDLGYTSIPSTPVVSLEELQGALQRVPCILGTDWYEGFFSPSNCGEMSISGRVAGGHEVQIIGWDRELKRIWVRNSWGDWGVSRGQETGFAYFSVGTLRKLLNAGAEIDCPSNPP